MTNFLTHQGMLDVIRQMKTPRKKEPELDSTSDLANQDVNPTPNPSGKKPAPLPLPLPLPLPSPPNPEIVSTEPTPIPPSKTEEITAKTEILPSAEHWDETKEKTATETESEEELDTPDQVDYLLENFNEDDILESLGEMKDRELENFKDLRSVVLEKKKRTNKTIKLEGVDFRNLYFEKVELQKNIILFLRNWLLNMLFLIPIIYLIGGFTPDLTSIDPYPNFTFFDWISWELISKFTPFAILLYCGIICGNAELLRRFSMKNTTELYSYFIGFIYLFAFPILCSTKYIFGTQINDCVLHLLFVISLFLYRTRPRNCLAFQGFCMIFSPLLPLFFALWYFLAQTNNAVRFKIRISLLVSERTVLFIYGCLLVEYLLIANITNYLIDSQYTFGQMVMIQWSRLSWDFLGFYLLTTSVLLISQIPFFLFLKSNDLKKIYQYLIMVLCGFLFANPLTVVLPSFFLLFNTDLQIRLFQSIEQQYLRSKEEQMFMEV